MYSTTLSTSCRPARRNSGSNLPTIALHTVTPYGRSGGSSRVRVFDWLDHLGLDATQHDYLGLRSNAPQVLARRISGVVNAELELRRLPRLIAGARLLLSKQASPFSNGSIEASLLSSAGNGVYDVDDSLLDETGVGWIQSLFPKGHIWRRSVQAADTVVVGNEYLADQALELVDSDRVVVIPSCVEPGAYLLKKNFEIGSRPRAVWIGSPTTEAHLLTLTEPLLSVHRTHGLRLTIISSGDRNLGPLSVMADRVAWQPDALNWLADADFGLMPLADTPRARGKCAYKLLQYGAAGLPAIASPVGANVMALGRGLGMAAMTSNEWRQTLVHLIEAGADERERLGTAGRTGVETCYSFKSWARLWTKVVLGS